MPKHSRYFCSRVFAAALALFIALAPVTSMRAYAAEGSGMPDDAGEPAGQAVHKYVISNTNPDPMYWHDADCRQDIDGVAVAPGDPEWPDKIFGDGLDGELLGHHDGRCYKTYIDDPTLGQPAQDPAEPEPDGEGGEEEPIETDRFQHDGDCFHVWDLICGITDPDHEHGDDCYGYGYVDRNGWDHNEDCIKVPYKPGVFDGMFNTSVLDVDSSFSVILTPSEEYPEVGQTFEYTVELSNPSDDAVRVSVRLELDNRLSYVDSDSASYDESSRDVLWTDVEVPADDCLKLVVSVSAVTAGEIYAEARATGGANTSGNTTVTAKLPAVNYQDLPSTGGAGTGSLILFGLTGTVIGCIVYAMAAKRKDCAG